MHKDRHKFPVKRGDLIEVHRGVYKHWAICESVEYCGDWQTIWCFHVGVIYEEDTPHGVISYEPLTDILADSGHINPSKCRINNQETNAEYWIAKEDGLYKEPNLDRVFEELHEKKDKIRVKYDLKTKNCEHYVNEWKYGISWSAQIDSMRFRLINDYLKMCSKQVSNYSSNSKERQKKVQKIFLNLN